MTRDQPTGMAQVITGDWATGMAQVARILLAPGSLPPRTQTVSPGPEGNFPSLASWELSGEGWIKTVHC